MGMEIEALLEEEGKNTTIPKPTNSGRHGTLFRRGEPSEEMSQLQTHAHAGEIPRVHSKQKRLRFAMYILHGM